MAGLFALISGVKEAYLRQDCVSNPEVRSRDGGKNLFAADEALRGDFNHRGTFETNGTIL